MRSSARSFRLCHLATWHVLLLALVLLIGGGWAFAGAPSSPASIQPQRSHRWELAGFYSEPSASATVWSAESVAAIVRPRVHLDTEERAFLDAHPDVVLGVDRDWQPLLVRNPDGSFAGIDGDTIAVVDAVLGTLIRFETGAWGDLVGAAKWREIDGLSSSAALPERAADFLFTKPYSSIGRSVLVRGGNPLGIRSVADLAGRKVGFWRGSLASRKAVESVGGAIAVEAGDGRELINALIGGRVDAIVGADIVFYYLVEKDIASVEQAMILDDSADLVLSIRKDWPMLVSAIDKVLLAFPAADRVAIKQRHLADAPARPWGSIPLDPNGAEFAGG